MTDKERIEELRKNKFQTIQFLQTLPKEHIIDLLLEYRAERNLFEYAQNQKAVEALKKVKTEIERKLDAFTVSEMRMHCGLFAFWIENEIDNLIKELGGKE